MEEKVFSMIRKILIALLIVWFIVVFALSNQTGEQSGALSKKIAMYLCMGNEEAADNFEPMVRKIAHMTEFAIGAMLFYGILVTYQKFSFVAKVAMTALFIVSCAGLDELHQSFIDARSGNLLDVGIDSFGGALGIGGCYILGLMINAMDNKVKEEVAKASQQK